MTLFEWLIEIAIEGSIDKVVPAQNLLTCFEMARQTRAGTAYRLSEDSSKLTSYSQDDSSHLFFFNKFIISTKRTFLAQNYATLLHLSLATSGTSW